MSRLDDLRDGAVNDETADAYHENVVLVCNGCGLGGSLRCAASGPMLARSRWIGITIPVGGETPHKAPCGASWPYPARALWSSWHEGEATGTTSTSPRRAQRAE